MSRGAPQRRAAWVGLAVGAGSFAHPLGLVALALATALWGSPAWGGRWLRAAATLLAALVPPLLVVGGLELLADRHPLWQALPLLAPLLALPDLGGPHHDPVVARARRRRLAALLAPLPLLLTALMAAMAAAGFFDTSGPAGPSRDAATLYALAAHALLGLSSAVVCGGVGGLLALLAPGPDPALADAVEIALRHASSRCERRLGAAHRWSAVVRGVTLDVTLDDAGAPARLLVSVPLPVGTTPSGPPPGLLRALPDSAWPPGLPVDLLPAVMEAAGPRPGSSLRDGRLTLVAPLEGVATRLRGRTSEERTRATHRLAELLRDATGVARAARLALEAPTR